MAMSLNALKKLTKGELSNMVIEYQNKFGNMLWNINTEIISNNNSKETVFKIFDETGVTVNSRDVEACHRLNQKANPKEVIMELSKRKDVARVMNISKRS